MDKETINDSENINSDEWKFLLLMMLMEDGFNEVLFNPDDCVAVSSDLVEVKGIDLKLDEPMIYKVGTPKLKEEMTSLDWMK